MLEDILLYIKDITMDIPQSYGWFHLESLLIVFIFTLIFVLKKKNKLKTNPRFVLGVYGISTLVLEIIKQLMLAVRREDDLVYWQYSWYSAPFQFCTMGMYAALIIFFTKNETIKKYLYSFLGYYSIVSMLSVALYPSSIYTEISLINIHTTLLHFGGLIISLYVLINELTDISIKSLLRGLQVFIICTVIALLMDYFVYALDFSNGEYFNMFYISPFYEGQIPILCDIQKVVPYPIFFFIYILAISLGALLIYVIARLIKKANKSL